MSDLAQETELQYVNARTLANLARVNDITVRKAIDRGELAAFKKNRIWYVEWKSAQAFIESWKHVTHEGRGRRRISVEHTSEHASAHQSGGQMNGQYTAGDYSQCGSCGTTKGNIVGDVDEHSGKKYGYLCMKCYKLVIASRSDIPRMHHVLDYLERTRSLVYTESAQKRPTALQS